MVLFRMGLDDSGSRCVSTIIPAYLPAFGKSGFGTKAALSGNISCEELYMPDLTCKNGIEKYQI